MIPQHSMAERIKNRIKDPRIKQLAINIIESQSNEIELMTQILNESNDNNYLFK